MPGRRPKPELGQFRQSECGLVYGRRVASGLYFVASNDQGKTFSARQLVDPNQKIGKHAHLVGFGNGKAFVTWDDADAKTFSVWGIIDLQNGLQQKSSEQAGIAYPVAAVNGKIAVIVGMKMATHEVVTFIENLN